MNVKMFEENSVLKLERSMNDWTDKQNIEVIQIDLRMDLKNFHFLR